MMEYCRVKWMLKLFPKEEIGRDAPSHSNYIAIKIGDTVTSWFLKLEDSSGHFKFSLLKSKFNSDKDVYYSVNLYYLTLNKINELKGIHISNEADSIVWKIKKDLLIDKLKDKDQILFNIVFNVRELKIYPENNRPSLAKLSERALMEAVTIDNVLDMLNYAFIYNSKELESKCMSIVMLIYEDIKEQKEHWRNLRPPVMAKILDTFNGAIHVFCEHSTTSYVEAEYDTDEEELNEMVYDTDEEEELNEMVHDLGFNSDDDNSDDDNYDDDNYDDVLNCDEDNSDDDNSDDDNYDDDNYDEDNYDDVLNCDEDNFDDV